MYVSMIVGMNLLICAFVQQSDPPEWQDRHGSGQVGSKMRNEDTGNVNHATDGWEGGWMNRT